MKDENSVILKGVPNGILIMLNKDTPFDTLKSILKKKISLNKNFFEDANTSINFKGRELDDEQELELLNIISEESGLEISFVGEQVSLSNNLKSNNQETLTQKSSPPFLTTKSNITYYHKGSLRSGQTIEFAGSVVIIGDVKPGAKVLAEGNVIILGKLKGSVHAGCKGDENCFVSALEVSPSQLIIKSVIAFFPEDLEQNRGPEYVYLKNGEIFVEQLPL